MLSEHERREKIESQVEENRVQKRQQTELNDFVYVQSFRRKFIGTEVK